jgi:hypothetical protein
MNRVIQSEVKVKSQAKSLMLEGLHGKHAVQCGIWVSTQHLLWDQGKPGKTLIELACRKTFRIQTDL